MSENLQPPEDFCVFRCGGVAFALSTHLAKEVIEGRTPTPVPLAPSELLGALNVRGEIIPVVNLESLLGLQEQPAKRIESLLVVALGPLRLAIPVDRVTTVERLSPWEVRNHSANPAVAAEFVSGHASRSNEILHVVDGEKLIHAIAHRISEGFRQPSENSTGGAQSIATMQEE